MLRVVAIVVAVWAYSRIVAFIVAGLWLAGHPVAAAWALLNALMISSLVIRAVHYGRTGT